MAVALALSSSLFWGVADFFGGLQSRRRSVLLVLLGVEGGGLLAALVAVAATGEPLPDAASAGFGAAAGLSGIVGLGCFYRALAVGTMSIVAPISATGVAVPVVVGLTTGDSPGAVVAAGLACAVVGVVLASRESGEDGVASRPSIVLALVAAIGFGGYFVLADRAADAGVLWSLISARTGAIPVIAALAWARHVARPAARDLALLGGIGVIDVIATGCYAGATTRGDLSVVAVLGALYPVTTVVLARMFLGERLGTLQAIGVAAALTGVVLISAG